ncbi:MAG: 2-C-methyl-D-erythritol 4-phosphate cytidylyltransferase [SAR202 cluster bacterium]|nr:2-C-methyl-D-erythritol 4-phosphate cytidylyltransferase [SAR202 cluster bacterium]
MTKNVNNPQRVAAIVVAAGASRRMSGVDKVFVQVAGKPLLAHSVHILEGTPEVNSIVLVLTSENMDRGRELAAAQGWRKVSAICAGGARRQDSVRHGLLAAAGAEWVVIHDGARPCVDVALVQRGLDAAKETGAAIAAVQVKDTIKVVNRKMDVTETPSRDRLWAVQTPQVFQAALLQRAHETVKEDVTDDASMVERIGSKVKVFQGSYENIKVTTPEDLAVVELLLQRRGAAKAGAAR